MQTADKVLEKLYTYIFRDQAICKIIISSFDIVWV